MVTVYLVTLVPGTRLRQESRSVQSCADSICSGPGTIDTFCWMLVEGGGRIIDKSGYVIAQWSNACTVDKSEVESGRLMNSRDWRTYCLAREL